MIKLNMECCGIIKEEVFDIIGFGMRMRIFQKRFYIGYVFRIEC